MPAIVRSRASLALLVRRYRGNRAALSRGEGLSLNTIRRLLTLHGLTAQADGLAATTAKSGPRGQMPEWAKVNDRDRILAALAERSPRAAARALGMSTATLYRRLGEYGVSLRAARPPA